MEEQIKQVKDAKFYTKAAEAKKNDTTIQVLKLKMPG